MALDRAFWRGRRVLVTGHTGFKGAWLVAMLRALAAETTGYALAPPTDPALFDLLGLRDACADRRGDIRDPAGIAAAVRAADPEIVIHLAAQPLVRASYRRPVETYAVNVMGTVNLLEACRAARSLRAIVAVTTDKCYRNDGWSRGYRESDPLGGDDPYASSKACAELVVDAYRTSFFAGAGAADAGRGIALASARAGNVIGGGDFAEDRLVPDAVRAFASGRVLEVRNPLAVRPWQHVLEPLYGYLLLAERLHAGPAAARGWNFGPRAEESVLVEHVVARLAARWGDGARWVQDPGSHPHEATMLKLDSAAARADLGWNPVFSCDEAVDATVAWYLARHRGEDLRARTLRQVGDYLDAVTATGNAAARRPLVAGGAR